MIRSILVAIDGSEHATRAATLAADLAAKYGATLHVVQVVPPLVVTKGLEEFAQVEKLDLPTSQEVASRHLLGPVESTAATRGVRTVETEVLAGDPAERLLDYVRDRKIDLVVLGRRGLGRVQGLLMGSVSLKLSSLADCPVLTVK
jgi:nucleotide-binding universal stress UspA family protein